jgi:hypothetical protein
MPSYLTTRPISRSLALSLLSSTPPISKALLNIQIHHVSSRLVSFRNFAKLVKARDTNYYLFPIIASRLQHPCVRVRLDIDDFLFQGGNISITLCIRAGCIVQAGLRGTDEALPSDTDVRALG